jgi:S1-C subfamily serine protease
MIDANVHLRRVALEGLDEARPRGAPALDSWDRVAEAAERLGLSDALTLFARPSVTRSNGVNPGQVVWYGSASGVLVPLAGLPADQREAVAAEVSRGLERLRPLMNDREVGSLFKSWLNVPSVENDLFLVKDRPIITNWGLLPAGVANSAESREAHFRQGMGRFLPPGTGAPLFEFPAEPASDESHEGPTDTAQPTPGPLVDKPADAAGLAAVAKPDIPHQALPIHRPWLAVAIASAVAAALLLFLWIPGVLIYPNVATARRDPIDPNLIAQTRETLEQRARELEATLRQATCAEPGTGALPGAAPGSSERRPGGTTPEHPAGTSPQGRTPGSPPSPETAPPGSQPPPGTRGGLRDGGSPTQPLIPPSAASLAGPRGSGAQPSSLIAHLDKVTALVIAPKTRGPGASVGSAFFISDRHLITNRHVVEEANPDRVFVISRSRGRAVAGQVKGSSRSSEIGGDDFALIEVAPMQGQIGMTLTTRVARGDTVIAAGFPSFVMGTDTGFQNLLEGNLSNIPDPAITQGMVTAMQTSERGSPVMIHGATISQGNSGGPLSDLCGRSVGVNTYGHIDATNVLRLNFALRTEGLKRFLDGQGVAYAASDDNCEPAAASASANPQAGPAARASPPGAETAPPTAAPPSSGAGDRRPDPVIR